MESRIQRIFLIGVLLISATASFATQAQETKATDNDELGKIITPDIKHRTIKESDLDT